MNPPVASEPSASARFSRLGQSAAIARRERHDERAQTHRLDPRLALIRIGAALFKPRAHALRVAEHRADRLGARLGRLDLRGRHMVPLLGAPLDVLDQREKGIALSNGGVVTALLTRQQRVAMCLLGRREHLLRRRRAQLDLRAEARDHVIAERRPIGRDRRQVRHRERRRSLTEKVLHRQHGVSRLRFRWRSPGSVNPRRPTRPAR
jgi:hypothetical protein